MFRRCYRRRRRADQRLIVTGVVGEGHPHHELSGCVDGYQDVGGSRRAPNVKLRPAVGDNPLVAEG